MIVRKEDIPYLKKIEGAMELIEQDKLGELEDLVDDYMFYQGMFDDPSGITDEGIIYQRIYDNLYYDNKK